MSRANDDARRVRAQGRLSIRPEDVDEYGFIVHAAAGRIAMSLEGAPADHETVLVVDHARYVDTIVVDAIVRAVRRGAYVTIVAAPEHALDWELATRRPLRSLVAIR